VVGKAQTASVYAWLAGAIFWLGIVGCTHNPLGPLPPVRHEQTFEEHLETLPTPGHTRMWIKQFTLYDSRYNDNWCDWQGKFPDQAYALAYSLWYEYHNGKSRGTCGQFAAMYAVAARAHGYCSGALCTWTATSGHALGWIREPDGTYSVTDNQEYHRSRYKNWDEVANYARLFPYYEILNDKFEVVEHN
jgi:hypothetical protein